VRSGAVIHCAQCEHKYRIKASHVTRTLTTGPKTLDELDPLLRGDSVDLDPEVSQAPVRIDQDGNVVGLSGLSELMRQSDADIARSDAVARANAAANTAPPAARVTRAATPEPPPAPQRAAQARADARRRRSRMNAIIAVAAAAVVLVLGVTLYAVISGGKEDPVVENPEGPILGGGPVALPQDPTGNGTDPGSNPGPGDPGDPSWLTGDGRPYEDNEDYRYDPSALQAVVHVGLPADVPTLLTPAVRLEHEGWYILTPPRGSVAATGGEAIELIDLDAIASRDGVVTLQGKVTHQGDEVLIAGEAHIALIDPVGRVYAETYLPLGILEPGQSRIVQLDIAERYWERSSGVRATVHVLDSARAMQAMPHLQVRPLGHGPSSSLRISTPNPNHPLDSETLAPDADRLGRDWVGDFRITIWADDPEGVAVARFSVKLDSFYLPAGQWLDLVIHTPVSADLPKLDWHAIIEAR